MSLNFPVPTTFRSAVGSSKIALNAQHLTAFRACFERLQECLEFADAPSTSTVMEAAADFVLDFDIIARRALRADSPRYRLFQMYFLKTQSRQVCCTRLNLTEWTFASEIRAIEHGLGESFSSAGLFPLAPYFSESSSRLQKLAA